MSRLPVRLHGLSRPGDPTPKLTIGKGANMRVTKAGAKAEAHFDAIVNAYLATVGTKPGRLLYEWTVETIAGPLGLSSHGHWIAGCFEDWPRAKALGHSHWKWNYHYEVGAAERELEDFKYRLGLILPKGDQ
jgi:hypothetical protein